MKQMTVHFASEFGWRIAATLGYAKFRVMHLSIINRAYLGKHLGSKFWRRSSPSIRSDWKIWSLPCTAQNHRYAVRQNETLSIKNTWSNSKRHRNCNWIPLREITPQFSNQDCTPKIMLESLEWPILHNWSWSFVHYLQWWQVNKGSAPTVSTIKS